MSKKINFKHFIEEIIYGGNDGVVTTFAIISSFVGAGQTESGSITPALVLVLGIASLFADGSSMGLSNYLSLRASSDISNNSTEKSPKHSLIHGLYTFCAFVVFGFLPLIPYLFEEQFGNLFASSIVFSLIAFGILGIVRNKITGKNLFQAIIENLFVGVVASSIGFIFGYLLRGLI